MRIVKQAWDRFNAMPEASSNSHVLVVDDEHLIADTLALIFEQNGYRASTAYSGEQAIEQAAAAQPDILLTDVLMDGINGIETAIRISQMWPNCRLMVFSGQPAASEILLRARAEGHRFEILPKPIHPDIILQILRAGTGRSEA